MQKFSACKNRDWLIHFFLSTSSVCMIAIWPVGPPNEMSPSFNQKRNASANDGARCVSAVASAKAGRSCFEIWSFIAFEEKRKAHRNIERLAAGSPDRSILLGPSLSAPNRSRRIHLARISRRRDPRHESFRQFSAPPCPGFRIGGAAFRKCNRHARAKNRHRACRTSPRVGSADVSGQKQTVLSDR